jgi:hypothetical protein
MAWKCLLDLKELHLEWDVDSWNGFIATLCKYALVIDLRY